jgi:DNA-directed RNA polymerase subunit RPC12/RpoP
MMKCKWTFVGQTFFLVTACGKQRFREIYIDDFKYCPYCGKKIEVVK